MTRTDVPLDRMDAALRGLTDRGVLTAGQSAEVSSALARASAAETPAGRWWAEVAGYLGGVLVAGGAALLLATAWDTLTDAVRALLLSAIAVVLIAAGLVVGRVPQDLRHLRAGQSPARRRVVGVLFALASGATAGAAAVAIDGHEGMASGAAGLIVAGGGYAVLRTMPGLLATALMSVVLLSSTMAELDASTTSLEVGLAYLVLGAGWIAAAAAGLALPRPVGLGVGAALAIVGAQQPLADAGAHGWAYALTFGVALGCFALYRWQRETVLLVAGVVGVAIAAPEAVWDWTGGAVGGAVILLVAGTALIGASAVGLGLWQSRRVGATAKRDEHRSDRDW